MTTTEVIMAGFGGQGMLLCGKLLAYTAMKSGQQVTWLPSYGPEMRGGTANVTVCVSDHPVGSPYITTPSALLVMNQPSLEKFAPRVKPGGLIIVNQTLIPIKAGREDCRVIYVDAGRLALDAGASRAANIVMLGVYVGYSEIVTRENMIAMIEKEFADKVKFIEANVQAFESGFREGQAATKGSKTGA